MARIFIVDDEEMLSGTMALVFAEMGHDVKTFTSGVKAIASYADFQPEIVFLDLLMPEMSGLDVLNELLKINPNLPVIVLTGVLDADIAEQAMTQGARDYLTKPFDWHHLRTLLNTYLLLNDTT